ncbi:hypothetical protein [uncultured Desulfobacter sp.]|uniref:hypothetical protein n=1 Tax=uncultured Desulfobacter sp. TaxID=240139 RepID=UPI0029F4B7EA|nr:hypothetical protein [uncultured Desulfobacter sp.]
MKKLSRIQIVMAVFFTLMFNTAYAAPVVILEVSSSEINVGDVLEINVIVKGLSRSDGILAFGFDIDVSSGLDFTGAVIHSDFTDLSSSLSITDVAGLSFLPFYGGGDDIIIATLNSLVLSSGTLEIKLESDISDPNEGLFTTLYPQLDITSSITFSLAPVPAPTSFILLGAGLLGMGVLRYRSQIIHPYTGSKIQKKPEAEWV